MRLATRPEALRAAEHIGLERRFVAGRFSHRQSVSRSRTRTTSESTTHTTGRAEGEATTHTTGTTTGQMYSEAEVPRHEQPRPRARRAINGRSRDAGEGESPRRSSAPGSPASGKRGAPSRRGRRPGAAATRQVRRSGRGRPAAGGPGQVGRRRERRQAPRGPGQVRRRLAAPAATGGRSAASGGKPVIDIGEDQDLVHRPARRATRRPSPGRRTPRRPATRARTSRSRTDGASVGDEITFELVYDHRVQPETLMALPEDQMLAPHIVEAAASAGQAVTGDKRAGSRDREQDGRPRHRPVGRRHRRRSPRSARPAEIPRRSRLRAAPALTSDPGE